MRSIRAAAISISIFGACRSQPAPTSEPIATPTPSASSAPARVARIFRHQAVETEEVHCDAGQCWCAALLGCGGKDQKPCVTYDENVSIFRTALKGVGTGKERRTVTCEQAEIGTCGDYRYFFFDGDIHRTELRFFDKTGAFVGEIALTDYPEYCQDRASKRVRGSIPECTLARTELICGKARDIGGFITSLPE